MTKDEQSLILNAITDLAASYGGMRPAPAYSTVIKQVA